jgi:hypothetical protein
MYFTLLGHTRPGIDDFTLPSKKTRQQESVILPLKGPKCEIFGFGIFAQTRPIWIG